MLGAGVRLMDVFSRTRTLFVKQSVQLIAAVSGLQVRFQLTYQ
jgi:hypothetical protein